MLTLMPSSDTHDRTINIYIDYMLCYNNYMLINRGHPTMLHCIW